MRRLAYLACTLLIATVCLAQTAPTAPAQTPNNPVGEIHITMPKPGMTAQYEQARKTHMNFHRAQKDPWSWHTWEIVTGPNTGSYVTGSFGHRWTEFEAREKFAATDRADADRTMVPTTASATMSYAILRTDLSRNPEIPTTMARMATATHYWLDPVDVPAFVEALKRINAGVDKVKYPMKPSRWYQATSGEVPHFVLITDRATWADMEPQERTLDEAMAEAYGQQDGQTLMTSFRRGIKRVVNELMVYRPDLSYIAAK